MTVDPETIRQVVVAGAVLLVAIPAFAVTLTTLLFGR